MMLMHSIWYLLVTQACSNNILNTAKSKILNQRTKNTGHTSKMGTHIMKSTDYERFRCDNGQATKHYLTVRYCDNMANYIRMLYTILF